MPGQPLKRKLIAALDRLAAEAEIETETGSPPTHLDFVEDWQARGKTLNALGEQAGLGTDQGEFISRYLRRTFGDTVTQRLADARARGSHRLVDKQITIAETATEDDVQVARLQVQTLQWVTEKWNPKEFGKQQGTTVNVSIGQLMLDALRQPAPIATATVIPDEQPQLSDGESVSYEIEQ